jgi:hypothetical protein
MSTEVRQLTKEGTPFYPQTHIDAIVGNNRAGVDDNPTQDSNNLVRSGGIYLYVNEAVSLSSGTFRGTSEKNLSEVQFLAWANTLTREKNDMTYWDTKNGNDQVYKRYKYDGNTWKYEFDVHTSTSTEDIMTSQEAQNLVENIFND